MIFLSEAILNPANWSTEFMVGVGIAGAIIAIILCIVCVKNNNEVFLEGFNLVSGGIFGIALWLVMGLFIPEINLLVSALIGGILSNENVVFPTMGSIGGWIILLICMVVIVVVWMMTEMYDDSFIKKLTCMLFFGAVYSVAIYLFIGLAIRMLLLAIGVFIVYCVVSSNSESTTSTTTSSQKKSSLDFHMLYDNSGNEYSVSHQGEFGSIYIRDSRGNLTNVYEWNKDYYRDNNGNLYSKFR